MKRRVKRETKGAAREIHRDAVYLARVRVRRASSWHNALVFFPARVQLWVAVMLSCLDPNTPPQPKHTSSFSSSPPPPAHGSWAQAERTKFLARQAEREVKFKELMSELEQQQAELELLRPQAEQAASLLAQEADRQQELQQQLQQRQQ